MGKENGAANKAGDSGSIHLSLQGKGGVGKSFAASVLAQYFQARDKPLRCIDTDPVNKTLTQFEALHVEPLVLLSHDPVCARCLVHLNMKTFEGRKYCRK